MTQSVVSHLWACLGGLEKLGEKLGYGEVVRRISGLVNPP